MHIVGFDVLREILQRRKIRNSHVRTLHMARNTEKRAKWKSHTVGI